MKRGARLRRVRDGGHEADDLLVSLALREGGAVEELDRVDVRLAAEHRRGAARLAHVLKHDERARLVQVVDHGVVRRLRETNPRVPSLPIIRRLMISIGSSTGWSTSAFMEYPVVHLIACFLRISEAELLVALHALGEIHDAVHDGTCATS